MCQLVTFLLHEFAVGRNQQLLDHWLAGTGTSLEIPWGYCDTAEWELTQTLVDTELEAWALGKNGKCNQYVYGRHRLEEPTRSNRHNYLTYLIFGWRFWFSCGLMTRKNCDEKGCCKSISTKVSCRFNAHDTVDFWKPRWEFFVVPPFRIHGRLVRRCLPQGKGFEVNA